MSKRRPSKAGAKKIGRNYTEVLLETMQSDFQAFGESLEGVDQKFTRRFNEVDKDLDHIKSELALIRHDIGTES